MKRYRVCIKNAKECQTELTFSDLCVKYSNGFSPVLKIKEGEEVPLSVCDPEDIRKSWLVGSLRGYLENKWIEEIKEDEIKPILQEVVKNSTSQFITEQDIKIELPKVTLPPQQILPEVNILVEQPVLISQNEPITDLKKIFSYDDFCRLTHFLKLRFIKETENIELLREISSKTSSAQLKNNIQLRFSQIKI